LDTKYKPRPNNVKKKKIFDPARGDELKQLGRGSATKPQKRKKKGGRWSNSSGRKKMSYYGDIRENGR